MQPHTAATRTGRDARNPPTTASLAALALGAALACPAHAQPAASDPQLSPAHTTDAPLPAPGTLVVPPPPSWQTPAVLTRDGVAYYLVEDGERFVREQLPADASARVTVTRGPRPLVQFDIVADPGSGSGQSVRLAPWNGPAGRVVLSSGFGSLAFGGGGFWVPAWWRLVDVYPSSTPWGDPNDTDPRRGRPVRGAEDFIGPIDGVYSPGYRSPEGTPVFDEPGALPMPENVALAALGRGDHAAAAAYFEAVLRYHPANTEARRWLGLTKLAARQFAPGAAEVAAAYRAEPRLASDPIDLTQLGPEGPRLAREWATPMWRMAADTRGHAAEPNALLAAIALSQAQGEQRVAARVFDERRAEIEAAFGPEVTAAWARALGPARGWKP